MSCSTWSALGNGASILAFYGGGRAAWDLVIGGRNILVARDGIVIPSCLQHAHNDLEEIRKIFQELDDEERARIEELRHVSDKSLSELRTEYKEHLADCRFQIVELNDMGWLATWNPFNAAASKAVKDAQHLTERVALLRRDVVMTTSGRLRQERLRLQQEREAEEARRQREREAEDAAPTLPLTEIRRPTVQTPPQACLVARTWDQLPATLLKQSMAGIMVS